MQPNFHFCLGNGKLFLFSVERHKQTETETEKPKAIKRVPTWWFAPQMSSVTGCGLGKSQVPRTQSSPPILQWEAGTQLLDHLLFISVCSSKWLELEARDMTKTQSLQYWLQASWPGLIHWAKYLLPSFIFNSPSPTPSQPLWPSSC